MFLEMQDMYLSSFLKFKKIWGSQSFNNANGLFT